MSNLPSTEAQRGESRVPEAGSAATAHYRVGDPAPSPLKPFRESELIEMWGGKSEPVVSILCPTYNHREYISDALDGFLGQVTDFPFEVIVRDDASTDGTADIVRDYASRYPRVIRAIIEPSNTFSKGASFIPPLAAASRGAFVALCAGDDYWISATKLAIQLELLNRHPESSMVSHGEVWVESGQVWQDANTKAQDLQHLWSYPGPGPFPFVNTWLFRRRATDLEAPEFNNILQEDNLIHAQLRAAGPVAYLSGLVMTARRRHGDSIWSAQSDLYRQFHCFNTHLWMAEYFFRTGNTREGRRYSLCAAADIHDRFVSRHSHRVRNWTAAFLALVPLRRLLARRRGSTR